MQKDQYLVDVIGFNATERALLSSIFALAARRDPGFAQLDASAGVLADLYLVDADDPAAWADFRTLRSRAVLPSVLAGLSDHGSGLTLLSRPLQWARLLQALEDALGADEVEANANLAITGGGQPDGGADKSGEFRRTRPGNPAANASKPQPAAPAPRSAAAKAATKRALGDTVLVVDDNATVRMFMQAKLAPFGFEVDFAETGEQAVGLTGSREYTCVFLDVVLPGIDGYQVCKLIKGNKQAIKKTAVVMLTSRSSPFDKLRGSLAGCDEYLTKPLDENRLLEVIAKFLPNSRQGG